MSVDTRLLFKLGLRLIPVIVKAGLAILGVGGQEGSGASGVLNLWPSLMAFRPATHAVNGVRALEVLDTTNGGALRGQVKPDCLAGARGRVRYFSCGLEQEGLSVSSSN